MIQPTRWTRSLLLAATALSLAACEDGSDALLVTGRVVLNPVEGGCWQIVAANGEDYLPVNLPEDSRIDGDAVVAVVEVLHDHGSPCPGAVVEVVSISRLDP